MILKIINKILGFIPKKLTLSGGFSFFIDIYKGIRYPTLYSVLFQYSYIMALEQPQDVKNQFTKMNKLLKDAIADAKAVRETALANAKIALEEIFQPRLERMFSEKMKTAMADLDSEDENQEIIYEESEDNILNDETFMKKLSS